MRQGDGEGAARRVGRIGEDAACRYFSEAGFEVLARNYTVRGGEIDLVVTDRETLVFVEVKTRKNDAFGRASEAVDRKKIARMCTAAERYLYEIRDDMRLAALPVRFDVIEVYTQNHTLRHIKGIDVN